jgi:CRISPR-associated endonuclease/helicase Cas3
VNVKSEHLNNDKLPFLNTEIISLLSNLAGLFHDFGKATALFQEKIKLEYTERVFEPYRHEWVSLRIFQAFTTERDDKGWLEDIAYLTKRWY